MATDEISQFFLKDCSKRVVERVSEMRGGQLFLGNHAATLMNGGDLKWKGTGIIVTGITYWPDPLPGVPTLTSDPSQRQSSSSGQSNTGTIVGVVVGVVGLMAFILAAIVVYRRRRSRASKPGNSGEPRRGNPISWDVSLSGQHAEGQAVSHGEKSVLADAVITRPGATVDVPRNDVKGSSSAPGSQLLEVIPTLGPASQPLPVTSSAQLPPPDSGMSQLSAQQLRLVQELMDNGLPSTQVVSVVQSMLTSSGSSGALRATAVSDTELGVGDTEPPPEYDFKDGPARGT